ncbi:PepSY-like domain-containing protein [Flavobacterium sp. ZS1P14]|uniref:PepSY-like domain-containing protein n=1 Tax=Flavobacterium sp. ZS1P14 TaxID=3401729 RepID=UPI003AAC8EF0
MDPKIIYTLLMLIIVTLTNGQGKKISISELPKEASFFLSKHFPNNPINRATKDWEHGEKGYEVRLTDGTEVEFTKDGAWREVDGHKKAIPTDYIPKPIVNYVKANYPNERITHIDKGHKDVDVDLTHRIDLEFDTDGKFLKVD